MKFTSLLLSAATGALALAAIAHADDAVLSGRIYANFSNISNKVDGVESNATAGFGIPATNGTGLDVKRFYVGVDNIFNRLPPFGLTGTGAGGAIYSDVGRTFYAGARVDF